MKQATVHILKWKEHKELSKLSISGIAKLSAIYNKEKVFEKDYFKELELEQREKQKKKQLDISS